MDAARRKFGSDESHLLITMEMPARSEMARIMCDATHLEHAATVGMVRQCDRSHAPRDAGLIDQVPAIPTYN